MVFPVVNTAFKKVFNSNVLDAIHRKGFAGPSLSVGEDCDDSLVENEIENWPHLEEIKFFV
jgi:hypothetical protein